MCLSQVTKLIYLALMFVIFCLTVAGTITPHWRDVYIKEKTESIGHVGLVKGCGYTDDLTHLIGDKNFCKDWWDYIQPKREKTVKSLLFVAMAFQLLAMGWIFLSCLAFCFHSRFMHALTGWSTLVFLFLIIPTIMYAAKKNDIPELGKLPDYVTIKLGYSFGLIAASAGLAIASGVIGAVTAWLSDQGCCC